LKDNLQVDLLQSSSTTYDLHAHGFVKSLLQACSCQQQAYLYILNNADKVIPYLLISLSLGDQITTTLATSVLPVSSEQNS